MNMVLDAMEFLKPKLKTRAGLMSGGERQGLACVKHGILSRQDKGLYEFTDPIFKTWLRKKYMPTIL